MWLALGEGLTRIEYTCPVSIYDDKCLYLPGKVLSVVRHGAGNDLYAGTTGGVFQVENNSIRQISGEHAYCLLQAPSGPNRIWVVKARGK